MMGQQKLDQIPLGSARSAISWPERVQHITARLARTVVNDWQAEAISERGDRQRQPCRGVLA